MSEACPGYSATKNNNLFPFLYYYMFFYWQIESEMHKKHVTHGWGEQVDSHREQMITARNEQKRMENQMEMDRLASLEKERQSQETKLQEEKELAGQLKDQVNELRQREAEVKSHDNILYPDANLTSII